MSQKTRYRVRLVRIVRDSEETTIEVEATSQEEAEASALMRADYSDVTWSNPEPIDSGEPEVFSCELIEAES